ncbi:unnamed protein product [Zymoseptoria tritici ST99CH_1E4]|uniref:Uncharacterized protein n=1 Tax=Zymoseptoria tritici ST99CH_1E4 TaxID=1276532 RepID=A0A2H1GQC1_ZYMTR|nr:unnamed protein product [Zymoseptoria tritici ST99CH_1E4]
MANILDVPEVSEALINILLPDVHIVVHRKKNYTHANDQYHISWCNAAEWATFLRYSSTNSTTRARCNQALQHGLQHGTIKLIMDMARHPVHPGRRRANHLLDPPPPMWLLQSITRLEVLCPYTADDMPAWEVGPETETATMQVSTIYRLFPPHAPGAPLPGQNDIILGIDWKLLYSSVPNPSGLARTAAYEVEWAIRNQLHPAPVPFLPTVNAKGLYDLGMLFAIKASKFAQFKECYHYDEPRFNVTVHEVAVDDQLWVEAGMP